jgi:hypothetical protein
MKGPNKVGAALKPGLSRADTFSMSKDHTPIDPNLFGMAVSLPSIPMRVCEPKTEEAQPKLTISYSEEVVSEAKAPLGWRERLAKLSLRPNA